MAAVWLIGKASKRETVNYPTSISVQDNNPGTRGQRLDAWTSNESSLGTALIIFGQQY